MTGALGASEVSFPLGGGAPTVEAEAATTAHMGVVLVSLGPGVRVRKRANLDRALTFPLPDSGFFGYCFLLDTDLCISFLWC